MICELKITSGCKRNKSVFKFQGDPTFRRRVISEKQCYAADEIHRTEYFGC